MSSGGTNHQASGAVAARAERQVRAFELSLAGHSLRAVAAIMSAEGERISHESVRGLISAEAIERVAGPAEEYRAVLLAQLEDARRVVLAKLELMPAPVTAGREGGVVYDPETGEPVRDHSAHLAAVDRLLRINERVAKLTGADMAQKIEGNLNAVVTEVPADVAELMRQARERNEARRGEISGEAG
ncbi:hypothetical protein [Amycolatopsis sp. WAC 01376]|uniref:hypothetical protein n=1 Tax=Amycolatopsis sp. WAC 01376 TaxID=2203195 RepID=UPI000F7A9AFD|nr:hypothetical protein [Amycolatopsis sp. WAC 01376]